MKRITLCAAAMIALASAGSAAPGAMEFEVTGARSFEAHAIYPAADTGKVTSFGGNKVWAPFDVQMDAALTGTRLPLVVLSHGMFGHRHNQTWLATQLAEAGYVVLALNHPGTSHFNRDPALSGQLWERTADITRVIDAFLDDPDWAARIDTDAIFAIGHSLGGWAVLAAAGARFDVDQLTVFCGADTSAVGCTAFNVLGVDPNDSAKLNADMTQPHLRAVVALDPGGTMGFTDASLAALRTPVLLISGGRTPEILDPTDESDRVARVANPDALTYMPIAAAGHFDFLGRCNPNGLAILKKHEPDDVMVCELGTEERAAIHQQVTAAVLTFLNAQR